jgi:hypothetical protein
MKNDSRKSSGRVARIEQALKQAYQTRETVVASEAWAKEVMREIRCIPRGGTASPVIELSPVFLRTGLAAAAAAAVVLLVGTVSYMTDGEMQLELAQYQSADMLGIDSASLVLSGKE